MGVSSSVSCYEKDVKTNENSSKIHVDFSVTTESNSWNTSGSAYYYIKCGNQSTGNINFSIGKGTTKTFSAEFGPFTHNNDGTYGPLDVKGYANLDISHGVTEATTKAYFTTIPRASDFSFSGTTLGSQTTVNITRASNSFTHTVVYSIGNISQSYTNIGTTATFTRPYSDANVFGSTNASGTGSITVITYNNGTEIGRKSKNIVMTLPDNNDTKPVANSATAVIDSVSRIKTKFNAYIQKNSIPKFTFNYSGRYGATIKNYSVTFENNTVSSSSNVVTLSKIQGSGTLSYTCKITDSRGRVKTETGTISVLAYTDPNLKIRVERNQGSSCTVYITGSVKPLNNLNDKTLKIKYKTHTASTYQNVDVSLGSTEYNINKTIQIPVSESSSYDFYGQLTDFFQTYTTTTEYLSTAFDLLHLKASGLGIGIGKKAEVDALDIGMDMYYKGKTINTYLDDYTTTKRNDYIKKYNTYSTSEVVIGKWINNKPIYRKVVKLTISSTYTAKTLSSLGINNFDEFITLKGMAKSSAPYSASSVFDQDYWIDGTDCFRLLIYNYELRIDSGSSWPQRPYTLYVIMEYTKTTD